MAESLGDLFLPHQAVLWRRIGTRHDARPVVSDVAEGIECRWDEVSRVVRDGDGNPMEISGEVIVDFKIPVGSAMWKGSVDDLPGTAQTPNLDVMEVMSCEGVADIHGQETCWSVTLARAGDLLPATGTDPLG